MGARRIALFGLAAIGAIAAGIGIAEMQRRLSASVPAVSASANEAPLPASSDNSRMALKVKELRAAFLRSRTEIVREIREDCAFQHPGENSRGVRVACIDRQRSILDKMKDIWTANTIPNAKGIIVVCMDQSRSLNGFDWQNVSWCFERTAVAARRGT